MGLLDTSGRTRRALRCGSFAEASCQKTTLVPANRSRVPGDRRAARRGRPQRGCRDLTTTRQARGIQESGVLAAKQRCPWSMGVAPRGTARRSLNDRVSGVSAVRMSCGLDTDRVDDEGAASAARERGTAWRVGAGNDEMSRGCRTGAGITTARQGSGRRTPAAKGRAGVTSDSVRRGSGGRRVARSVEGAVSATRRGTCPDRANGG